MEPGKSPLSHSSAVAKVAEDVRQQGSKFHANQSPVGVVSCVFAAFSHKSFTGLIPDWRTVILTDSNEGQSLLCHGTTRGKFKKKTDTSAEIQPLAEILQMTRATVHKSTSAFSSDKKKTNCSMTKTYRGAAFVDLICFTGSCAAVSTLHGHTCSTDKCGQTSVMLHGRRCTQC